MLWLVPLAPLAAGPALWAAGRRPRAAGAVGPAAVAVLAGATALALGGALAGGTARHRWGAGLDLTLDARGPAPVAMVLVPAVAAVVVAYAAAHESRRARVRLLATLVAFTGAMQLLVLAGDVLTLLVAWELVGACSWALIGHRWWEPASAPAAAQAFVTTRAGDLGLFAAAGAALAGAGSLRFDELGALGGGWRHLFVAGVVLAAAAKSAQVPFSPWLFSAMAGPTSVSALLHAATMVAAGAYLLVRLQPVLDGAGWFGPVVIGIGLATALAGGVLALVHRHAKKVLAASTSAQYGLMFVAVGAGAPAAAVAHLVTHAVLKAGLFLGAGIAMEGAGTPDLGRQRLGRALPAVAVASAVAALALGGVPPLGGAWTKEALVAAAGHRAAWLAVAVAVAGALGTAYALRFQLLAFGGRPEDGSPALHRRPAAVEVAAVAVLAAATAALGLLWLPGAGDVVARLAGAPVATGAAWEAALSLALVAAAAYGTWVAVRRAGAASGALPAAADWWGLPAVARAGVVDPVLALSRALARFDRRVLDAPARAAASAGPAAAAAVASADARVVDAGVRGAAALAEWAARAGARLGERGIDGALAGLARAVGSAGADLRRAQTGLAHHALAVVAGGLGVLAVVVVLAR